VADGEPFLALTAGSNRADQDKLAALMGAEKVRRADAEEARTATGYGIGGTPPFGHPKQLRVFVDRDLMQHDEVWAAAGTPDSVFPLTPDDLIRAAQAEPADFREE
jgi:prolyl-tRNA editing enzyme YbaK/EbsC (Cys-tRNA(Pro) deacylase)